MKKLFQYSSAQKVVLIKTYRQIIHLKIICIAF